MAEQRGSIAGAPWKAGGGQAWRPVAPVMMLLAAACAALALLVPTDSWAAFFAHPAQERPELTRQGAALFRFMLGVSALMLIAAPLVWRALLPFTASAQISTSPGRQIARSRTLTLLGLVVLALLFRATRLNESLWYDEIASWMTYSGGAQTMGAVVGNFFDPINHPLHTLLNHLSMRWFSDVLPVEIAFRLPTLIFSLLSVLAMYWLGRAAAGERTGFIAAGLAAILPVSVLEGAEARGYSMVIFFSAMMTWTLMNAHAVKAHAVDGVGFRARDPRYALYALWCALGIWAHFVTAFVPIGHGVWLLWRAARWREWRQAMAGFISLLLAAAITITLYAPMIPGMLAARAMFVAERGDQPTLLGVEGFHTLLQLGGSWYWWAAAMGLALLVIGCASIFIGGRSEREIRGAAVELAIIGLPLMIITVALSGTWVYARFTFFALPAAMLLMALGMDALWRWRSAAGVAAVFALLILSIADLAVRPPKQPLRDAAEFVAGHRDPEDRLLVVGLAHEVLRIYAHDLNLTYSFMHGRDLPRKLAQVRPRWVIVEYPRSVSAENFALLRRAGFEEVAHLHGWADWGNGDVVVYRR